MNYKNLTDDELQAEHDALRAREFRRVAEKELDAEQFFERWARGLTCWSGCKCSAPACSSSAYRCS